MIDREELKLKVPYSAPFAFLHLDQPVATDAMFFQLARHQREGQLRTVNRNVGPLLEQIGHGTNVVLMAVGEHQGADVVETIRQQVQGGKDEVDARVAVLRKEHTTVNQDHFTIDLEGSAVPTHIAEPSQGCDTKGSGLQGRRRTQFTHPQKASANSRHH